MTLPFLMSAVVTVYKELPHAGEKKKYIHVFKGGEQQVT